MWKIIVLVILIGFGAIVLMSYFLANQQLGGSLVLSQEDFSQLESMMSGEESNETKSREFIDSFGKLEIEYSSDWKEIKDENGFKGAIPEKVVEEYELEILLLAGKLKKESFSQLMVSRGKFEGKSLEETIEIMKEINGAEGWATEIINPEFEGNEVFFEAVYRKENFHDLHSKEKIIMLDEEGLTYFAAFLVNDSDWESFKEEASNTIYSVQHIK